MRLNISTLAYGMTYFFKSTVAFLFLFIMLPICRAYSQSSTDTLYSVVALEGDVFHWYTMDSMYMAYPGSLGCGDGIDGFYFTGRPIEERGYVSFDLSQIQTDTSEKKLSSATFSIYQLQSFGDDKLGVFPIFNNQPGRFPCVLDHVDYGDSLDWWDWFVGENGSPGSIHRNIGILSQTPEVGFRRLNITEHVQEDLNSHKKLSQYLIRFRVDHDNDSLTDNLVFRPTGYYPSLKPTWPQIILEWQAVQACVTTSVAVVPRPSLTAWPNPFNASTEISFSVPQRGQIRVAIYDILGRQVERLWDGECEAGEHRVRWSAGGFSSGLYLAMLAVDGKTLIHKVVIAK
jgi:hypothetical protein